MNELIAKLDLGSVENTRLGSNPQSWMPSLSLRETRIFVRITLLALDVRMGRYSSDTVAYFTRPKEDNKMSLKLEYFQRAEFK